MKSVILIAICSLFIPSLAVAQDRAMVGVIERVQGGNDVGALYLVDGKLLLYVGGSERRDAKASPYESIAWNFKFSRTANGTFITVHPKGIGAIGKGSKNLELDGFYLTADYSAAQAAIKLTKAPEKYSIWEVPQLSARGEISNKNEAGVRFNLGLGELPVRKVNPTESGDLEYREAILSTKRGADFRIKKLDPGEVGR